MAREEEHHTPEEPLADRSGPLRNDGEHRRARVAMTGIASGRVDGEYGLGHRAQA